MKTWIGRLALLVVFALVGCGGGGGGGTQSTNPTFAVEGRVLNGVVVGSTVEVRGANHWGFLGTATTDRNGRFSARVSQQGPYRLLAYGGTLNGFDYTGNLEALCSGGSDCLITPYTTVLSRLVDEHGFNPGDAASHLANGLGLYADPFAGGVEVEGFDLNAARQAIAGGYGLEAWVEGVIAWANGEGAEAPPGVTGPAPAEPPSDPDPVQPPQPAPQPDPGPMPDPEEPDPDPVVPVTHMVSVTAGAGGNISPPSQAVDHGETATFTVTPATGYSIDNVTGCGGSLMGNTYTTGAITAPCTVEASFGLSTPGSQFTLSGPHESTTTSVITLTVTSQTGSSPSHVEWRSSTSEVEIIVNEQMAGQASVSVQGTPEYRSYSAEITATADGHTLRHSIVFYPQFVYDHPNTHLALMHEHEAPNHETFGNKIIKYGWLPNHTYYAFDTNDWVNRRIVVDFDLWWVNSQPQYRKPDTWILQQLDEIRNKWFSAYPHVSENRLVLMYLDGTDLTGRYYSYAFQQDALAYGEWTAISTNGRFVFARPLLLHEQGSNPGWNKVDIQIFLIDPDTMQAQSSVIRTSDFPEFGYAQRWSDSRFESTSVKLERHYSDILISGFSSGFERTSPGSPPHIHSLWIPLSPNSMTIKQPFWIKADRFKRDGFDEQPSLSLGTSEWGGRKVDYEVNRPWSPRGSFSLGNDSGLVTEGWMRGVLDRDYQAFELTTYGSSMLDTTPYRDYHYEWGSEGRLAAYRYEHEPTEQRITTLVGSEQHVLRLPPLVAPASTGCSIFQNGGKFTFDANCKDFDSYWVFKPQGLLVRNLHEALAVDTPGTTGVWHNRGHSGVSFLHREKQRPGTLELDDDGQHPGCTLPKPYFPEVVELVATAEETSLQFVPKPMVDAVTIMTTYGDLDVEVFPFERRAPVLCSDYKVSLDQTLTVLVNQIGRPILHGSYDIRRVIRPPLRGTYNSARNEYRPELNFRGVDLFEIEIDDGTGTQIVKVGVRVI